MLDKPSIQDLLEVQRDFDLPSPVLVEKDWHVVGALAAIITTDVKPFRLVFGGGTALSRAHRLTRRMLEDIDLKIVSDAPRSRAELRTLRDTVTGALLNAGFAFDPANAAHRDSRQCEPLYGVTDFSGVPAYTAYFRRAPGSRGSDAEWPVKSTSVSGCRTAPFVGNQCFDRARAEVNGSRPFAIRT